MRLSKLSSRRPIPWRDGFDAMVKLFDTEGRPKQSLCGVELRCPAPMTSDGFHEFNIGYRNVLEEWDIIIDGVNPVGRTNVSPVLNPPSETLMYGFSYTVENADAPATFRGAGGGETIGDGIVAEGDMSERGMRQKAARVVETMQERLRGIGMEWKDVTGSTSIHRRRMLIGYRPNSYHAWTLKKSMASTGTCPGHPSSVLISRWICSACVEKYGCNRYAGFNSSITNPSLAGYCWPKFASFYSRGRENSLLSQIVISLIRVSSVISPHEVVHLDC